MKVDRNSATAVALRVIIEGMIEKKGRNLQRPTFGLDKTNVMRGELIGMRKVLALVSLEPVEDEEVNEPD